MEKKEWNVQRYLFLSTHMLLSWLHLNYLIKYQVLMINVQTHVTAHVCVALTRMHSHSSVICVFDNDVSAAAE